MCWEALNNISADKERNAVIIVNDNGRSYGDPAQNSGGLVIDMQPLNTIHSIDPESAIVDVDGGVIAVNREVSVEMAKQVKDIFLPFSCCALARPLPEPSRVTVAFWWEFSP